MNGAMAEPLVKTIRPPNISKVRRIGRSQYFFLVRRKPHNSIKKFI
jgi:hypothetical protein